MAIAPLHRVFRNRVVRAGLLVVLIAGLSLPAPAQQGDVAATPSVSQDAGAAPAEGTAAPAPGQGAEAAAQAASDAPAQSGGPAPNLTWQKFPAEFADYYTTQRVPTSAAEPQPFTKSAKPLKVSHPTLFTANAILDESGGTGTGYDTLYIDSGSGDFSNPTVYKISPQERKTGLEGHALVSYFDNVTIQRGEDSVNRPGSAKVQLFVEQNPDRIEGTDYLVNMIPAQWAVGTIQVNGQPTPVAVVDGTFDGELTRRGMRPQYINNMSPGDDAGVVRSDYLIIGKPGETSLQPGDPNGWLGKTGSARSMFTQYLTTDSGIFEIQMNEQEAGVNLNLAPANVPTTTIDLSQVPHDKRLAMFGTNACVLLENPGNSVLVPADSYYLPSLGSQLVEATEGQTLPLTPAGVEAEAAQADAMAADRGQRLFTNMEPPGGALGATQWSEPTAKPFAFAQPRPGWKKLELTIVGENNRPIAGATVDINCYADRSGPTGSGSKSYKTDSSGKCVAMLPGDDDNNVNAQVQAPDHVGSMMYWGTRMGAALPEQFTWPLEKGTPIGGIVVDEHGKPIRGVQVRLDVSDRQFNPGKPMPVLTRGSLTTDARGKWVCKTAPAKLTKVTVSLSHPEYVSDDRSGRTPKIEELRNQTAEMVMKPGVVVSGRVTDSHGKPVEGAMVMFGDGRYGYSGINTDKQGRFKSKGVKPGEMMIQVQAKGLAPASKKVTVEEHMRPVDIELKQGNVLKGRVVDESGNPVPRAMVWLQRSEGLVGWSGTTDAQGNFTWKDAPEGEIVLGVQTEGYEWQGEWKVRAGQDNVFTLKGKPLLVTGRVVDATTRSPIAKFRVVPGMFYGPMTTPQWMSWQASNGKDGAFQLRLSTQEQVSKYQIRIEAAGYKPGKSIEFTVEQAGQPIEIALEIGKPVEGVVVGVDGQPVVGAQVGMGTSGNPAMVYEGHLQARGGGLATSGEGGKFTLDAEGDEYTVIAVDDSGIGQVSQKEFESSGQVKLQAWGRIEGKADIRKRKASEQEINIGTQGSGPDTRMHFSARPQIEEDGTFVIEKVVPGNLMIFSMSRTEQGGAPGMQMRKRVAVKPGETAKVSLESSGKTVSGRVASSGIQLDWKRSMVMLFPVRKAPKVPAGVAGKDRKAIQEWYAKWVDSEEGQAARAGDEPSNTQPKEDGTFAFENIAPGSYVLQAMAADPSGEQRSWQLAAFAVQMVKVPAGSSDAPVEAGTVTLKATEALKKGQAAPDFDLRGLDGKTVRLSDFGGKYVWLTFWSGEMIWGPSMMSNMMREYTKDDRVGMISVELESGVEDARNFSLIYDMPGVKTYGGEAGKSAAAKEYGVTFMPSFVLIDPQGKIETNSPDPSEALKVLRKALGPSRDAKAAASQTASGSQPAATQASKE